MWQEARKHERKLRGMMVDYKRRGERRRQYYEKIKKDPAQFLQVHGQAYKIHLDSAVALAAESPLNMMPWQGDTSNMIDRFDVRAHLDYIPTCTPPLLNTTLLKKGTFLKELPLWKMLPHMLHYNSGAIPVATPIELYQMTECRQEMKEAKHVTAAHQWDQ
ncbi:CLK4-associating serine/arginine rich protein-like [Carassius carassius]|uniref:CLK4-associating serine/arginine rich protein-like n=1 Tax=Carassius carassius TaxID=217509 RepID=UPI0028687AA6|nr:CLK4-associating serine/arginine rich protein-like [Carassius carassius]